MPEIKKMSYTVTVDILGTDERGRTLVSCPAPVTCCGEQPYLDGDRFVCPMAERIRARLAEAFEALAGDT